MLSLFLSQDFLVMSSTSRWIVFILAANAALFVWSMDIMRFILLYVHKSV